MSVVLVTATIPHVSGLPQDSVVNNFVFDTADNVPPLAASDKIFLSIERFYNIAGANALPLRNWLSRGLARSPVAGSLKMYNITNQLAGTPHGSPIDDTPFALLPPDNLTEQLPEEVAAVITTRGLNWESQQVEAADDADAGLEVNRPRQRHSGRMFIGPLTTSTVNQAAFRSRVTTNFQTTLLEVAERLALEVRPEAEWCVWSRKNAAVYRITHVQVDNAFDTQRRRGPKPDLRTTVAIAAPPG